MTILQAITSFQEFRGITLKQAIIDDLESIMTYICENQDTNTANVMRELNIPIHRINQAYKILKRSNIFCKKEIRDNRNKERILQIVKMARVHTGYYISSKLNITIPHIRALVGAYNKTLDDKRDRIILANLFSQKGDTVTVLKLRKRYYKCTTDQEVAEMCDELGIDDTELNYLIENYGIAKPQRPKVIAKMKDSDFRESAVEILKRKNY